MSTHAHIPWSDDERTMLRRLWDNGLSQRQIALLMGRSKNSVNRQCAIQRLHRGSPIHPPRLKPGPVRVGRGSSLPTLPSLASDGG